MNDWLSSEARGFDNCKESPVCLLSRRREPAESNLFLDLTRGGRDASPEDCVLILPIGQQSARFRATIFQTLQRRNLEYNEGTGSRNESLIMWLSHSLWTRLRTPPKDDRRGRTGTPGHTRTRELWERSRSPRANDVVATQAAYDAPPELSVLVATGSQ